VDNSDDRGGLDRITDEVYVFCALVFKWDKEQVDRQPTEYLKRTVELSQERINEIVENLFKGK
jgi:hypothetical protein